MNTFHNCNLTFHNFFPKATDDVSVHLQSPFLGKFCSSTKLSCDQSSTLTKEDELWPWLWKDTHEGFIKDSLINLLKSF